MVQPIPLRSPSGEQLRDERVEILRMLEAGAISVEEAAALLDALDRAAFPPTNSGETAPRSAAEHQVRIRVTDGTSGKSTVNLAFPLGLIKSGPDTAGQFVPEYLPKAEAIRESIAAGFRGSLVDVDDGEQRVEIIVE